MPLRLVTLAPSLEGVLVVILLPMIPERPTTGVIKDEERSQIVPPSLVRLGGIAALVAAPLGILGDLYHSLVAQNNPLGRLTPSVWMMPPDPSRPRIHECNFISMPINSERSLKGMDHAG
jgi:hypothetical protein